MHLRAEELGFNERERVLSCGQSEGQLLCGGRFCVTRHSRGGGSAGASAGGGGASRVRSLLGFAVGGGLDSNRNWLVEDPSCPTQSSGVCSASLSYTVSDHR